MLTEKRFGLSILDDLGLQVSPTVVVDSLPDSYPCHLSDNQSDAKYVIARPILCICYAADQVDSHMGIVDPLLCNKYNWKRQFILSEHLYKDFTILEQQYYNQAYGGVIDLLSDRLARIVSSNMSTAVVNGENPHDIVLIDFFVDKLLYARNSINIEY